MTDERPGEPVGAVRNEAPGHGMGLFVALTFGSAYPAGARIVEVVHPFLFSTARYVLAGSLLLLYVRLATGSIRVRGGDRLRLALLGFLGFSAFQGLWAVGLQFTTPGKAAILITTTPIFGALIAVAGGERFSARAWTGIAGAFAGVFMVINGSFARITIGGGSIAGDLLFVGIAALWATYGALSRPVIGRLGARLTTAWSAFLGACFLAPLGLVGALEQDWSVLDDPWLVASFLHVSLVVGSLGMLAWSGGLARLGLARMSVYLYLVPVMAVLISGLLLDEWLNAAQVSGAGLVMAGVLLTQTAKRGRALTVRDRPSR